MKKVYVSPEMEVLLLETADIITASPTGGTGGGENSTPMIPFNLTWEG